MKQICEGYCGRYVQMANVRTVNGERFCEDCYEKATQ